MQPAARYFAAAGRSETECGSGGYRGQVEPGRRHGHEAPLNVGPHQRARPARGLDVMCGRAGDRAAKEQGHGGCNPCRAAYERRSSFAAPARRAPSFRRSLQLRRCDLGLAYFSLRNERVLLLSERRAVEVADPKRLLSPGFDGSPAHCAKLARGRSMHRAANLWRSSPRRWRGSASAGRVSS